jgi:MHS family proline/betaine transporter-like MFS transporter
LAIVLSPLAAAISDRVGRKRMLQLAALVYLLLTYPAYMMLTAQPSVTLLMVFQSGFALMMAWYGGPVVSVLAELFPTRSRAMSVALTYSVAVALAGGFAPFIVTWLMAVTGDPRAPAFYVIGAALISGVALFWLRDRYDEPLPR